MNESGKIANLTRGQLNRMLHILLYLILFEPKNLVSRDMLSRPVPRLACSFSTLGVNMMLTHGIPPRFARVNRHRAVTS